MPHALHVIGGYRLHKLEDIQNQNHQEVGHTHKESTETKKNWKSIHPKTVPARFYGTWGSGTPTSPLGVTFVPEIENLCGNHIL